MCVCVCVCVWGGGGGGGGGQLGGVVELFVFIPLVSFLLPSPSLLLF